MYYNYHWILDNELKYDIENCDSYNEEKYLISNLRNAAGKNNNIIQNVHVSLINVCSTRGYRITDKIETKLRILVDFSLKLTRVNFYFNILSLLIISRYIGLLILQFKWTSTH